MRFGPPDTLQSSLLLTGAGPSNGGGGSGGLSNDTSLSEFTIDSEDVLALSSLQRSNAVTDVPVTAVPTHAGATRTINASSDPDPVTVALSVGDNTVTVTVTAEDGVTTEDHVVTVRRLTAGVQEVTEIVIPDGSAFVSGGEGRGFLISTEAARFGFWAATGTETEPSWSGVDTFVQVPISAEDGDLTVAGAFRTALQSNGFLASFGSGSTIVATCIAPGARADAEVGPGSFGISITVTQQGADPS